MIWEQDEKVRKGFLEFYKKERNSTAYNDDKSYALLVETKIMELSNAQT